MSGPSRPRDIDGPGCSAADLVSVDGQFRSAQRLEVDVHVAMPALADRYFEWLQRVFRGLVMVEGRTPDEEVVMRVLGVPAVRLRRTECDGDRMRYAVEGGALARRGGEFVFERVGARDAIAILQGFRPRLPPWLYRHTHGRVHTSVMRRFRRYLEVTA